jgi:hypothetical protein
MAIVNKLQVRVMRRRRRNRKMGDEEGSPRTSTTNLGMAVEGCSLGPRWISPISRRQWEDDNSKSNSEESEAASVGAPSVEGQKTACLHGSEPLLCTSRLFSRVVRSRNMDAACRERRCSAWRSEVSSVTVQGMEVEWV